MAGFYFAVLLCFKHLFVVAAPVYFVYLLRHYCRGGLFKGFGRLLLMGLAVVVVFVGAFWPFVCHDQLQKRLICVGKNPRGESVCRIPALFQWHRRERG
ncbi:probable dolichyl pyrophosphate Glc1Man9GlcNAc2 alpha-1,3-glucosyltransferase [Spinacia oleracea]|uniref:Alpha-1,3-glucosyltransferase n=1 Tax=Spinacia oleracea TaxID=3562 RepID=A0ABM3QNT3_SPIOL|nr:probable dolichyl pyrophosphate Glc1Man9GlcNAc2 alpha-1,3-glucosyltransferase [Spinacia oleracea]